MGLTLREMSNFNLSISTRQKSKILFWLYVRCMAFAVRLRLINADSAYQKCLEYGLNTLLYRIGKCPWRNLKGLPLEVVNSVKQNSNL